MNAIPELQGRTLRQTEYKFYAPGKMATAIGRGTARPDEGVEPDTMTLGELADDQGLVNITQTSPAAPAAAEQHPRANRGQRAQRHARSGRPHR